MIKTQTNESACLISMTNVSVNLNSKQVLSDLDLELLPGEIVTIIGPNGAGKSTLIRVLLGLIKPNHGQITQRPGLSIGYVPQKIHLDHTLPLSVQGFLALAGRSFKAADIFKALTATKAEHLINASIHDLSGGEFQRVLLARALLRQPDLLVLDEPVQGVDMNGQSDMYQLINQIRDQHDCGILMVSHDLHFVMARTDKVICLNQHICCSGRPEAVSSHPSYLEIFGKAEQSLALYTHHHDHHHTDDGHIVADLKQAKTKFRVNESRND